MPHHGQVIGWPQATTLPTYTVWLEAGVYYAMNNTTGAIDFQDADPAVVVQASLTAGGAGCTIGLREAEYAALTGVAMTADYQHVYGSGRGCLWDATALLTGVHAFRIETFHCCELRNFSVETDAGGGLVNHCVFINDGANDFHIIDMTFVDSDTNCIQIEGTTITMGHIHRCHIIGADGHGILIDMDGANFMYRLHIEDCDIGVVAGSGIIFLTSGGNHYCEILNNIIYNVGAHGISLNANDLSQLRGNIVFNAGANGLLVSYTSNAQILANIIYQSASHGISIIDSHRLTIDENHSLESDLNDTASFDGIHLSGSTKNIIKNNHCYDGDRWGIMIDLDSDFNKVGNNYTDGNTAGSIRVNNANCDGNQLEFNTVEEGAPGDVGTLTRSYGNFDPSANAFVGNVGAAPF